MSSNEQAIEHHVPGTTKLFVWVWVVLLILTGLETWMAYADFVLLIMLTVLMGLSVIKTGFILSYFMHLRFEKFGLFLMIVPSIVFLLLMILFALYPDSLRLLHMRG